MASSKMYEGYCADVDSALREGLTRHALRLALALPDMSAALESADRTSSAEQYAAWCAAWLEWDSPRSHKQMDGTRMYQIYSRRKIEGGRPGASATDAALSSLRRRRTARLARNPTRSRVWHPVGALQTLEVSLAEGLVKAARRWYASEGVRSAIVQRNLGILAVSH